ncbi:PREDICTED: rho GTPase-activating protein 23 [Tinamus guttatus]|uniref:rho GTPase-activating protein 23 n=1 Tax=Tinamus guttatus TaxID=94827 RepID=UPI00052EF468|nr:PREDICTED: rho GTPase-activating protein 23 [Tinamus guttatus]
MASRDGGEELSGAGGSQCLGDAAEHQGWLLPPWGVPRGDIRRVCAAPGLAVPPRGALHNVDSKRSGRRVSGARETLVLPAGINPGHTRDGIHPWSGRAATPGRRDGASPNANAPPEEPFPWVGPKTVALRKSPQGGFGFTLRHFIVYPPEAAVHSAAKEEENGNRAAGPPRSRLEPMDTIFVKSVREDGPAHQAGLRTGDRLVKVNGESIIGKTYSQVIALIQNSDDVLELSIMPKDEDILQLGSDSLSRNAWASMGFADEPTSPSIDLKAKHVPASSVVSSAMNSAPAVSTSPSSPTFAFALNRHYSQDCSSIKASRRSSYLLAITTERSKSCDDGLNTFRDEGKILRRLPSRVPSLRMLRSFFTDGSLDSLGTSEETRSKRHSACDLSDVPFSDVRREGWLHYKQILTKKGKKVGGGMRQWKRVFAVLRARSLSLCKDRREAVTCAPPAPGEEEPPISIRACLVDISYSETKRKHVFRLTTADFCEYLFQAEDREDMLAWIKVIRENGKAEGEDPSFASQALINKKLNDYRKVRYGAGPSAGLALRPPTGTSAPRSPRQDAAVTKDESSSQKAPWGINIMKKNKKSAPRAFGVRLEDCQPAPDNKNVPLIVEACCKVVEDRGLEYMGIYRVPGNNAVVSSLQEQLNKGATEINLQDERWQDLNVISSLLKSFFRKLPEPLFTDDKYNDFIEANRIEDASERMRTLRKLIRDLPGHYYETLKFLVGHLKTIADHSEKNKMEPRNLALVFGPTLVRTSEDNMTDMVTHMPDRYKIVETLIQHADWFFSDKEDKGEKTPVDEKEAPSVPNIEYLLPNIGRTLDPQRLHKAEAPSPGSFPPGLVTVAPEAAQGPGHPQREPRDGKSHVLGPASSHVLCKYLL